MNRHDSENRVHPFEYVASALAVTPELYVTIAHGEISLFTENRGKNTSQFAWVYRPTEVLPRTEAQSNALNREFLRAQLPQTISADLDSRTLTTKLREEQYAPFFMHMRNLSLNPSDAYVTFFTDAIDYHIEFDVNKQTNKRVARVRQVQPYRPTDVRVRTEVASDFLDEGFSHLARINHAFTRFHK
jgi:hypothetical protein